MLVGHGVGHRGEVDVDAGGLELARPAGGRLGQRGGRHRRLLLGRRRPGEPLAAQLVHLAALLVGGDEQPDVAGALARHQPLQVLGGAGDLVGALPAAEVDDVADVRAAHEVVERAERRVGVEADHEQLAQPLLGRQGLHGRRHAGRRGVLGGRGGCRGGRRARRGTRGRRRRGGRAEVLGPVGSPAHPARARATRAAGRDGQAAGRQGSRRREQHPTTVRDALGNLGIPVRTRHRSESGAQMAAPGSRLSTRLDGRSPAASAMIDPMPSLPVVLDVDTGVDDACALLLAALHPRLDLRAVTCVGGNAPLADVVRNTLVVLETAGRGDVPVGIGAAAPAARGAGRRPPRARRRRHGRPRDAGAHPAPRPAPARSTSCATPSSSRPPPAPR